MKNKILAFMMVLFLSTTILAGCGGNGEPEQTEPGNGTRVFTDSVGREVTLPETITKVAVSGPMAQIGVFAAAPDMLVGIALEWTDAAKEYMPAKYMSLPVLGQVYGGKGTMNLEELIAAAPDVVIDIGEPKDSIKEDLDSLQEQTGIPFVHITAYLDDMGTTYRKLGELLSIDTEELAAYCERIYEKSETLSNELGSEGKAPILYCRGDKGLNVIASTSFHGQVLDLMTNNLAVLDDISFSGDGNEVDFEQLLNWDPEVIIFAPFSVYDQVGGDSRWQQLKAIANGTYYEVPAAPYNWVTDPPSVQRILGLLWISQLLYPQQAEYDIKSEILEYFKLFYHTDLTDSQYDELVKNSIGKQ